MGNPFILVGNAVLGFFTGYFTEKGFSPVAAVMLAFAIQLPWLAVTDHLLMGLSWAFIGGLAVSLAASNLLWAVAASWAAGPLRRLLGC
jgi:hypothetical protein